MPRALRALLAEDDVLIRMDVVDTLEGLGLRVTEVGTAEAGVAIIRNGGRFELVVTDFNMPGIMTGSIWHARCNSLTMKPRSR